MGLAEPPLHYPLKPEMVLEENDTCNSSTPGLVTLCMSTGKRIRKHMSWLYGSGSVPYWVQQLYSRTGKQERKKPTGKSSSSIKEQSFTVNGFFFFGACKRKILF